MSRVFRSAAVLVAVGGAVLAGASAASADSGAQGAAVGSPGVLSGNLVQVPVHVPVNVCGNTVSVIGALNPAFGNTCANASGGWGHHGDMGDWDMSK
ncbi:chaplin [Streptomyces sp. BH097]|uniref:chaplin n=1 Tax=unclassified Streptomyces TaxID=2593676 RepID=UPI003BB7C729